MAFHLPAALTPYIWKQTDMTWKEVRKLTISCLLRAMLKTNLTFKKAGLNRFYYLLYKRYNNSCTASVILYDVVFLFRKIHSVSLFEALFIMLLHLWMGN